MIRISSVDQPPSLRLAHRTTNGRAPQAYRVYISGLHEMLQASLSNKPKQFMNEDILSSFTMHDLPMRHDRYVERYAIGQILTRFALNLSSSDELPHKGNEYKSLTTANITSCRGNLVRNIALKLMLGTLNSNLRLSRPRFDFCAYDISTWDDERFHHFLCRFFDYINSSNAIRVGIKGKAKTKIEAAKKDLCPSGIWFSPQSLPNNAYEIIINGVRKHEIRQMHLAVTMAPLNADDSKTYYVNANGDIQAEDEIIADIDIANDIAKHGLLGIYRTYRNEAAHFFDFCSALGNNFALSRDYVNYWRTQFPNMVLVAWLVSIELNLYKVDSFAEFFPYHDDIFYKLFMNQDACGNKKRFKH